MLKIHLQQTGCGESVIKLTKAMNRPVRNAAFLHVRNNEMLSWTAISWTCMPRSTDIMKHKTNQHHFKRQFCLALQIKSRFLSLFIYI